MNTDIPTPPEGYRVVEHGEIPIVPAGAMVFWLSYEDIPESGGLAGDTPHPKALYAIPITN
jgi:hypothetical protein